LSPGQLAWLARIRNSRHFAWEHLRFSTRATLPSVPLIVFGDEDVGLLVAGRGAQILGAPCDILFDPTARGVFKSPSDVVCLGFHGSVGGKL
jgi:hypothetical protein